MADNDNIPQTQTQEEFELMGRVMQLCQDSSVSVIMQLVTLLAVARAIAVQDTGSARIGHHWVHQTLEQLEDTADTGRQ